MTTYPSLTAYGWNDQWNEALQQESTLIPARVSAQYSHQYRIITSEGERTASVSGKLEYEAQRRSDFPAVGDWVLAEPLQGENSAVIRKVLPRFSAMSRKEAGNVVDEQIIAANVNWLFITSALNQDFNLRKIERFLIAVWESGASPVVLLTKADLCEDPERFRDEVEAIAPGVPVHIVSAQENLGKEALAPYLMSGQTIAVTGSSGVGKSTLINWLAGQDLNRVQGIREQDARGRHTTTHRELFLIPSGAVLIDTPGMRELQLWDASEGWEVTFSDIVELKSHCRFQDCRHLGEKGCAVQEALANGTLDAHRYANYIKTEKELAHLELKALRSDRRNQKNAGKFSGAKSKKSATRSGPIPIPQYNEFDE
ncbi:ribosome biogenesis GTPase [Paenibacillus shirakamiensis]|uniref:Small ribosomal subunit biogenesis GTPase RsgA n=1 Tax=Paenibacillus shirakamiensis TaxID=1265935 RepID=A0ABS4JL11_9BACL|nr:ribosome small subunit-dependent GTPase A [Paenibacillus shirakamiensis]MBP2002402.1 ribosome biogenesis GTPase [Paenibacillus shirakamiensis]